MLARVYDAGLSSDLRRRLNDSTEYVELFLQLSKNLVGRTREASHFGGDSITTVWRLKTPARQHGHLSFSSVGGLKTH